MAKKKAKGKKTSNPSLAQVFTTRNISSAFLFVAAILYGFGGEQMSSGSDFAPWLIAIASLMVAIAIITNQDIANYLRYRLAKFWKLALFNVFFCLIFFLASFLPFQKMANNQKETLAKTPIFTGQLLPGNEPEPNSPYKKNEFVNPETGEIIKMPEGALTPVPEGTFRMMFGENWDIYLGRTEQYTFALRNQPFLKVKFDPEGRILLSMSIVDSQSHYIVRVDDNLFQANPSYAFRPRQPNRYTLVVQDWEGNEVLDVRYLNRDTLWVTGKFYSPEADDTITIHKSGIIEGLKGMTVGPMGFVESNPRGGFINIGGY